MEARVGDAGGGKLVYLLLVGVQTTTVTMETSVAVTQNIENGSSTGCSHMALECIPKGFHVLL